jgi:hypothetical protein
MPTACVLTCIVIVSFRKINGKVIGGTLRYRLSTVSFCGCYVAMTTTQMSTVKMSTSEMSTVKMSTLEMLTVKMSTSEMSTVKMLTLITKMSTLFHPRPLLTAPKAPEVRSG